MAARKDSIDDLTELMGSLMQDDDSASGKLTADAPAAVAATSTPAREKPSGDVIQEAVFKPLRPYQQQILEVVRGLLEKKPCRALLYLPTGGGKTRIAGETAKWALAKGWRVAFVVNRVALVDQSARAFREIGIPPSSIGYIASGRPVDAAAPLQIATMQTLAKRYALLGDRSSTGSTASAAADEPPADDGCGDGADGTAAASDAAASEGGETSSLQFDLLLLDEAHAATSRSYQALLRRCVRSSPAAAVASADGAAPETKPHVLGLTATPVRLRADEQLSRVFGTLIKGPSISDLIASGVLATPIVLDARDEALAAADKTTKAPAGATASSRAGRDKGIDSASRSKAGAGSSGKPGADGVDDDGDDVEVEVPGACAALVREWQRRCSVAASAGGSGSGHGDDSSRPAYRKTIVFAADVAHSHALTTAFRDVTGVAAAHIDGETTASTRESIFGALKRGDVSVVCSVGVLSEGFDEPSVSCVVLCRPTHSKALYIQQVGRGLRSYPGKRDCIVLDAVGNTLTHGPITGPLGCEYEWDGEEGGEASRADGATRGASKPAKAGSSSADTTVISIRQSTTDAAAAPAAAAAPSHGSRRDGGSTSATVAWVCPAQACRTIVHARVRACPQCGTVKQLSARTATDYTGGGSGSGGVASLVGKLSGMAISGATGVTSGGAAAKAAVPIQPHTKALGSLANALGGSGPLAPATLASIPRKQTATAQTAAVGGAPVAPAATTFAIPRKAVAPAPSAAEAAAPTVPATKPDGGTPTPAAAKTAHVAAAAPSGVAGSGAASGPPAMPPTAAAAAAAPRPSTTPSMAIPKATTDAAPAVTSAPAPASSARAPSGAGGVGGGVLPPAAAAAPLLVWREAVDGPLFSHPAFTAACARYSLPHFTLTAARNDWERDFLASVARQITPGAPHDRKRDPAESRSLSDKQEATLRDILARPPSGRSTSKPVSGGAAPGGR